MQGNNGEYNSCGLEPEFGLGDRAVVRVMWIAPSCQDVPLLVRRREEIGLIKLCRSDDLAMYVCASHGRWPVVRGPDQYGWRVGCVRILQKSGTVRGCGVPVTVLCKRCAVERSDLFEMRSSPGSGDAPSPLLVLMEGH